MPVDRLMKGGLSKADAEFVSKKYKEGQLEKEIKKVVLKRPEKK